MAPVTHAQNSCHVIYFNGARNPVFPELQLFSASPAFLQRWYLTYKWQRSLVCQVSDSCVLFLNPKPGNTSAFYF